MKGRIMMEEKELNELSLNELEQVSGGAITPDGTYIPDKYSRKLCCIVLTNPWSDKHYRATVTGNIPMTVGSMIYIPAYHIACEVTEVRPGASAYDNAIILNCPEWDGIGSGFKTTDVYVVYDYPSD